MSFLIVFVLLIGIILITTIYYVPRHYPEAFIDTLPSTNNPKQMIEDIVKPLAASLYQRSVLVTNPIVDAMNKVTDVLTDIPQRIWANGVASSVSIRSKLRKYAEGMTSYNRTPDDSESLKMVIINKRHKVYMDNMREKNKKLYADYARIAGEFYKTDFDVQDAKLMESLAWLATNQKDAHPELGGLLKEKIKST